MEAYLSSSEKYIQTALQFSLASPFTFVGPQTENELIAIYQAATKFASYAINKGERDETVEVKEKSNFKTVINEEMGDGDEQDILILYDYMLIDFIFHIYGLNSVEFKSGVSAYNLP